MSSTNRTPDQHTPSTNHDTSDTKNPNDNTSNSSNENLTPLEQQVLDEYARLLGNLNNLSELLKYLAANPSPAILDSLRGLERSTSLVYTLLKASVYSIVLNLEDERAGDGG